MTGSGTLEHPDRPGTGARGRLAETAVARAPEAAAFVLTAAAVGLLAADQGGYFPGAWRVSTPLFALVVIGVLWGARRVAVARAALLTEAGMVAFLAWTVTSAAWSADRAASLHDARLVLVYVVGTAALLLLAAEGRGVAVAGGVLAATTGVALFSMASRLYPRIFGMFEAGGYGRLYQPIGYWNGLGALMVIGIVLALGFAVRGGMITRMLAAAALIPLAPTLYLTFSRGALVGLAAGLLALLVLDPRRLHLIVGACAASIAAAGALLAVHAHPALTTFNRSEPAQAAQGAHTAARMISLIPLGMGTTALLAGLEARITVSRLARTVAGAVLVVAACVAVAVGVNRFGDPIGLVHDAIATLRKPAPTFPKGDLNLRLLSLSPNGRVLFWKAAWHDFTAHPVQGSGAGTYAGYWMQHRPARLHTKHAHSLELETMAELGVVGLAILLVAVLTPAWAGIRRRSHPLGAAITAAYLAYLVHSGGDWTWQLPGVTLAAIACGAAAIGLQPSDRDVCLPRIGRHVGVGLALAAAVVGVWP